LFGFGLFCFGSSSLFWFCFVFVFFSVGIVTATGLCSGPSSVHFWSPPSWRWMTLLALINWICQFATGLQAWWTTWRELWGVGRKKNHLQSSGLP
jgi:hypothetical protein